MAPGKTTNINIKNDQQIGDKNPAPKAPTSFKTIIIGLLSTVFIAGGGVGGGVVWADKTSALKAQVSSLMETRDDCEKRIRSLEEDRIKAAAFTAVVNEKIDNQSAQIKEVKDLLKEVAGKRR